MSFEALSTRQVRSNLLVLGIALAWTGSSISVLSNLFARSGRNDRYGNPFAANDYLRRDIGLGPAAENAYWERFR